MSYPNKTPVRFVVQNLYDDMDNPEEIITMPFVEEAKEFFRKTVTNEMDQN